MIRPRVALVTGANRGLGRAISVGLYAAGLHVVLTARNGAAARTAAAELGECAVGVALDVTEEDSVRRAQRHIGDVDVLVNNAGVLLDAGRRPSTIPLNLVEQEFAVNTLGAWRVSQAFLPGMVARGWGRIVMVSSGAAAFSNGLSPDVPGYAVSKAGLNAVTVLLAREALGTGVLVNAVNPGLVRTRMRPDADRSPEEAAVDVVWVATLPDGGPTGSFFRSRRPIDW